MRGSALNRAGLSGVRLAAALSRHRWLLLLLLGALLVRLLGITHDLPFSFYGDEAHFVKRAVAFGSGDLNPHWFHKPAGYMYLLFVEYGLFYVAGSAVGMFSGLDSFISLFVNDRSAFYLIGRLTTVAFGVGMVGLTYLLGRLVFGHRPALAGAALLAVSYPHVTASQVVKADVPSGFFVVLSLYLLLRAVSAPDRQIRGFALSGLAAGLGMGMKFYSMPLLPLFWFACIRRGMHRGEWARLLVDPRPWAACICFVAAFLVTSPYDFIDPAGFVRHKAVSTLDKVVAPRKAYDPDTQIEYTTGTGTLLPATGQFFEAVAARTSLGIVGTVLALAGMAVFGLPGTAIRERLLVVFFVLFMVFSVLGASFHVQFRHLVPVYPILMLFAAALVFQAVERVLSGRSPWLAPAVAAGILVVVAVPTAQLTLKSGIRDTREDTRNLARHWIEAHIPPDTKILVDEDGPVLRMNKAGLAAMVKAADKAEPGPFTTHADTYYRYLLQYQQGIAYDLTEINHLWWRSGSGGQGAQVYEGDRDADMGNPLKPRGVDDLDAYLERGVRYAVLNGLKLKAYVGTPLGERFPEFVSFYRAVQARGELVAEFDPDDGNHPGPQVWVYAF